MRTKIYIIIGILVVVVGFLFIFLGSNKTLSDEAIAIFHDDKDTYRTYIYKLDTGQANMGFRYVNAVGRSKSFKEMSNGEFDFTDGAFKVAREHGAYSYVTIPGNERKYSIEEFQSMFLMN